MDTATILSFALGSIMVSGAVLAAGNWLGVRAIGRRYPPIGAFVDVDGTRLHVVRRMAGGDADLPPIVFLHGASGNLRDQMGAFAAPLAGRADLIFLDRPGHGWSERGPEANDTPGGQAALLARLLDRCGIDRAIICGHSFGGSIAASFGTDFPDRTLGLLFLAPATHPWPGGVDWHYHAGSHRLAGPVFANTLVWWLGHARLPRAVASVFTPNRVPDGYIDAAAVPLALLPENFRANARDVVNLHDHVSRASPLYGGIAAPVIVITGDRDAIVLPSIHSAGLKRDIPHAELVRVRNLGHKPDYVATDLCVAALEKLAGHDRDLQAMARAVERRIAGDAFGPVDRCLDPGEAFDAAGDLAGVAQMPLRPSEPI